MSFSEKTQKSYNDDVNAKAAHSPQCFDVFALLCEIPTCNPRNLDPVMSILLTLWWAFCWPCNEHFFSRNFKVSKKIQRRTWKGFEELVSADFGRLVLLAHSNSAHHPSRPEVRQYFRKRLDWIDKNRWPGFGYLEETLICKKCDR